VAEEIVHDAIVVVEIVLPEIKEEKNPGERKDHRSNPEMNLVPLPIARREIQVSLPAGEMVQRKDQ